MRQGDPINARSDGHRMVFVGGLHRSGTTLLADCIADHPEVSGLSGTGVPMNEGQFLQKVYAPAGTKRTIWPIRYLDRLLPPMISHRGYGGPGRFAFDPGSHLTEESPQATPSNADRVFRAWAPFLDPTCEVVVEKSPPNLLRTRFLQELFPESWFIIVYRHPIPVSFATRRWARIRPLYFLFQHWVLASETFERDQSHLKRCFALRYEDFVASPEQTLADIYRFLELRPQPLRRTVRPEVNDAYFERWNEKISGKPVGPRYAEFLRDRFGSEFILRGYTLDEPFVTGPPPWLVNRTS